MKTILLLCTLFIGLAYGQDNPAYVIYTKNGKKTTYSKMIKEVLNKKLVFFGELHNDPIAHWMEYQMLDELYKKHGINLLAGSEMFEHDNASALDKYVLKAIDDKQLKDSCRLWPNFETDYQPMLDYAREQNPPIPWIATNIPRKYASLVYKKGVAALDTLSAKQKGDICPLPYPVDTTLSQYAALMNGEMHMGNNFVYSQAIKDATMGYFISQNLKSNSVFYHVNGSYHSDFHQGILWYVNFYAKVPFSEMLTISTVSQAEIGKLEKEYLGKADFIICVPEKMTKTH